MTSQRRLSLLTMIVPLALFSCGQEAEPETDQSNALLQTDREFARYSMAHGPSAAFAEFLVEDALQLPAGSEPISGRDNIVESMTGGTKFNLDWEPQHAEVSASGDLGWTWGTYTATFQDSQGADVSSAGKYLNVWRMQHDGTWRVVVDMGNTP